MTKPSYSFKNTLAITQNKKDKGEKKGRGQGSSLNFKDFQLSFHANIFSAGLPIIQVRGIIKQEAMNLIP